MPSYHLNHVNIRTTDLEKTRDFYAEVIGLKEGFRPPFPSQGYWMYAGDTAVIHISTCEMDSSVRTDPTGMGQGLDHFAMWGSGYAEQIATLEHQAIEYTQRFAGGGRVIQVFFHDPNGIKIELGFEPEAEGITADNFDGPVY